MTWTLSQISDRIFFVAPGIALADLRGVASYFGSPERISQTFLTSCQQAFGPGIAKEPNTPSSTAEEGSLSSAPTAALLGNHLLRTMIFLQSESEPGFRHLGVLDLGYRKAMRQLSWAEWCRGVAAFLSLYEQSQSQLTTRLQELRHFVSCLQRLRMPSPMDPLTTTTGTQLHTPEAARSIFSHGELNRRFGRFVAAVWQAFCQPMEDWESFFDLKLRQQEETLNPNRFATCSGDLKDFPPGTHIALTQGTEALAAALQNSLDKLRSFSPSPAMGIQDFSVSFVFASGHRLDRNVFLNEPFFSMDRTARAVLEQSCAHVLAPSRKHALTPHDKKSNGSQGPRFVTTPEGLAIVDDEHPERAYFVGHIETLTVTPLRIICGPTAHDGDRLFADDNQSVTLRGIESLRRELLVHHGQSTAHYIPVCVLNRPFATRPPPPLLPPQPLSDLFSHTLSFRPPAVLRRPLPFVFCPGNKEAATAVYTKKAHKGAADKVNRVVSGKTLDHVIRAPITSQDRLVFMESIGAHEFFVWTSPDNDTALWLCSPRPQIDVTQTPRFFVCLGIFDSLELLPDWVRSAGLGRRTVAPPLVDQRDRSSG
jgi:hypothetical protein